MNIANLIVNKMSPYIKKAHLAITFDNELFRIKLHVYQGDKKILEDLKLYEMSEEQLSGKIIQYITLIQKRYGYCYVSSFLSSINVGAIDGCSQKDFEAIGVAIDKVIKVCVNKKWTAYSSQYDIDQKETIYKEIGGLDYLFPIEVMLLQMIKNLNFHSEEPILYFLQNKNSAALTIFVNHELRYSTHFLFNSDEGVSLEGESLDDMNDLIANSEESAEELEEIVHLDDEDDDLLDDIEDLDDIVVDEDNLELEDVNGVDEEELLDESFDEYQDEISLKHDMMLFEFVKHSVEDYYKNERFRSEFLTKAVIFNSEKEGGASLQNYLQNELLVACNLVHIDLCDILLELSYNESVLEIEETMNQGEVNE
jgi:hypothetical protein